MILLPADVSMKCHNCRASNQATPQKLCYEVVKPQRDDATTLDIDITTISWIWSDPLSYKGWAVIFLPLFNNVIAY